MRARGLWLAAFAVLVAVLVIGLDQASDERRPGQSATGAFTEEEGRARLAGAPPALASLHRQANEFLPGGRPALERRLRALRGHPVVINVWAAWCGPCREELPVFQRASVRWGTRVGFVGVDLQDSRASAVRLLREFPVHYPSFEDPDGEIAEGYRLVGTPTTIFYDASGERTYVHSGPYYERAALDADIRRYALGRPR